MAARSQAPPSSRRRNRDMRRSRKMLGPRVHADQRAAFEADELLRKLSRESEVRYTGHRDSPSEERRRRFREGCKNGRTELAFVASGINLQLLFPDCHFEADKVRLESSFILNGVCVRLKASLNLDKLDGLACLHFDQQLAQVEEARRRRLLDLAGKISAVDDLSPGSASN